MLVELIKHLSKLSLSGPVDPEGNPLMALPQGVDLVSLERYAPHRYRERYTMRTSLIDAFVLYTNDRCQRVKEVQGVGDEASITSVDPDTFTARAIFDAVTEAMPGHCEDVAVLTLKALPAWVFLQDIGDRGSVTLSQRDLIDLIRNWHEHIPRPAALVSAFSKMSIESMSEKGVTEKDFGREKTAMEKMDLKAEGQEIPSILEFTFWPYEGFQARKIDIAISASLDRHDTICIRARLVGYESLRHHMAREFASTLADQLDHTPMIGTIVPTP